MSHKRQPRVCEEWTLMEGTPLDELVTAARAMTIAKGWAIQRLETIFKHTDQEDFPKEDSSPKAKKVPKTPQLSLSVTELHYAADCWASPCKVTSPTCTRVLGRPETFDEVTTQKLQEELVRLPKPRIFGVERRDSTSYANELRALRPPTGPRSRRTSPRSRRTSPRSRRTSPLAPQT